MNYKHIMVAIDGSATSKQALKEAVALAQDLKTKLRVLYIADESVVKSIHPYGGDMDSLWNSYIEEGEELLSQINTELKDSKVDFQTCLVVLKINEGHIAEKIVTEAQIWNADLLVIGTHGRRGISHFFLGSVAEKVVRIATMPVLLIRAKSAS